MPKEATVLRVLVASPSDVSEERQRLEEVVLSVNAAFASTGDRLELIRWERDASPGLGDGAQSVINDQLPTDYDIFVGIMWNTVGTPTERAESGTIEEFERALERFKQDPSSVQVMLYFKDSLPLSMDDINPEQLTKIREFRARVKPMSLYHIFKDTSDFANAVQLHLTRLMANRLLEGIKEGSHSSTTEIQESNGLGEEEGLLEVQETFEAEMVALDGVLSRMSNATTEIGEQMNRRTKSLSLLNAQLSNNPQPRSLRADVKRLVGKSARDMDRFVSAMQKELPLYRQHLDRGISAYARSVPLSIEFGADESEMSKLAQRLIDSMDSMLESIEGFKNSVRELPPLSSPFIRSKRATERALQQVIDIAQGGREMLDGVLGSLD